jgi:hypothetical protein
MTIIFHYITVLIFFQTLLPQKQGPDSSLTDYRLQYEAADTASHTVSLKSKLTDLTSVNSVRTFQENWKDCSPGFHL